MLTRLSLLFAFLCFSTAAWTQELAFPLTAQVQSRIPTAGVPADTFYLPGSAEISCFEGAANGSRYLCLSDSGSILEWTSDNKVRQMASGFLGPIQAKVAPDGAIYVLDLGRGTLSQVAPDGAVTRLMGSGTDRVIREKMDPKTFDLPLFTLSRDGYANSVRLAIDPQGNPYLGIAREEYTKDQGLDVTARFLYLFRFENKFTSMTLHYNGGDLVRNLSGLPSFDALSIDKDRQIFLSLNGRLTRLSASLQTTPLYDGRYTVLNSNPVSDVIQNDDGNIILHSRRTGNLFRLAFRELAVDLDNFASLNGFITRQGTQMTGFDIAERRIVRYISDPAKLYVARETGRLMRFAPVTGNASFRAAFDNPVHAAIDAQGQVYVVEGADGNIYRISANGAVTRIAKNIFNPDDTAPPKLAETMALDAMPYPFVAVAADKDNRVYMLDRTCTLYIQTGANAARKAKQFSYGACAGVSMLFDPSKRLHILFANNGELQSGSGDPSVGEWIFNRMYGSGYKLNSLSMLPSSDLLFLDGTALKRINPGSGTVTALGYDEALRNNVNFRPSSIAVDSGGRIMVVTCCAPGSSYESTRRFLMTLQLGAGDILTGQSRNIAFYDTAPGQAPELLFTHPRGTLIKTNQGRLYYFEDAQFRAQAAVSLPNRQSWTYLPDSGTQELAIPVIPVYGPTAFNTKVACDNGFDKFVRVGPAAAVAPTQLRFALDTIAAPPRAASCRIEVSTIDTGRLMANTSIDLVPDPARVAATPTISVLEQLTPFMVDPSQPTLTRALRLMNNSADPVDIRIEGDLPAGVALTPDVLTLAPKQSGDFTLTISPADLTRQNYQIALKANCAACKAPAPMDLSFQVTGKTTSIDITAEAALVDIGLLNARNVSQFPATSLVLSGLDESDVTVRADFDGAPAWFTLKRTASSRTGEGKLVLAYDIELNRAALPQRQSSNIVTFETQTQQGVARRFLTVFYFPEGTTAERLFESGAAGSTLNMATARTATITIPVFSRSETPAAYSTYTLGADTGAVTVASTQGLVTKGANEIQLDVSRAANPKEASEAKDIVIVFGNGERLIYSLNVITTTQQITQQSKDGARSIGACASARLLISMKEPGQPFTVVRNVGLRFVFELKDECNQLVNASDKAQFKFSTEPANGSVTVTSTGRGLWEAFWKPDRTGENIVVKVVAVRGVSEREIYVGTLNVNGRVADSVVPALRSFSVVDAVSFQPKSITAPGAFITIYGDNLAANERYGFDTPGVFPTELGGIQVLFNGKPAPLLYTSPRQINVQVPYDLENSEYRMVIRRDQLVSTPAALGVGSASPAIATANGSGSGQGQIYRVPADGGAPGFATPDNPARPGETVQIVATGLGATNPFQNEGRAVGSESVPSVSGVVQVYFGGRQGGDVRGFLAPGQIGIYIVTTVLPADVPAGDAVPVIVRANGVDSQPTVTMAIQPAPAQ